MVLIFRSPFSLAKAAAEAAVAEGAAFRRSLSAAVDRDEEEPADPDFLAVYPHVTTIRGTTFRCRGGDPAELAKRLEALFTRRTGKGVSAQKVA